MDKPSYYAIISANVRYDNSLPPNAKLLYGEVTALCSKDGICTASNDYFAKLYEVSKVSISKWIKLLEDKRYIKSKIIYKEGTKQILNRYLTLVNDPIKEKFKKNNTSNNNTKEISNNKLLDIKKSFQKPSFEDVKNYCEERKNNVDAQLFIDFYESNGWKVGKNAMKDWKACIRTWERNNKNNRTDWQSQKMKQQEEAGRKFLEGYCD